MKVIRQLEQEPLRVETPNATFLIQTRQMDRKGRSFDSVLIIPEPGMLFRPKGKKFKVVRPLKLMGLLLMLCVPAQASTADYFNHVVDQIYIVEGGENTNFPFGIKSVGCSGYADCRKVAYNTVRNNWNRWEAAGRKGNFLEFLADRYCPKSSDPVGNKNWKANIKRRVSNA